MALLSLLDVYVSFGGPPVLDHLNLQIEEGERVCLLGRNGAGKTTLMRIAAGESAPDTGTVTIPEGVCIARNNGKGIAASFTVRKISFGEGVERVFPLYSTNIEKIEVVRRGKVRRAKLYYLRARRGKSARIAEDNTYKPQAGAGANA